MFIIGLILVIAATVFVLENGMLITVNFLRWHYDMGLGVALIASFLVGAVVIYFSGLVKQRELRAQVRAAEMRVRELERQQKQAAADETQQPARQ